MPAEGPHRFSPRPNRAAEIPWREWGDDVLAEARAADKPLLLSISALWCHWCHVMDETTYSDPRVIERLGSRFIPVRVDSDARPDVDARYNAGGWPTTAILDAEGAPIVALTYVSPEPMVQLLDRTLEAWHVNREGIESQVEELRHRRSVAGAEGALSPSLLAEIAEAVDAAFDDEFGGFGPAAVARDGRPHEPKFARPDALRLLLYRHRRDGDAKALERARITLERMSGHAGHGSLLDRIEGGWFRYATARDWTEPHYEKLALDQGRMLQVLADLARSSEEDAELARELAELTADYAEFVLSVPGGGFAGSQDADAEYYDLDAAARAGQGAPLVDNRIYTNSTAALARGLLACGAIFDEPAWSRRGAAAVDFLWSELRGGEAGMYHALELPERAPQTLGLLTDQSETLVALLDAYESGGHARHLDAARQLARIVDREWREPHGACRDVAIDHERAGLLDEPRLPLAENAQVAEAFVRLGRLTHDEGYLETAREILEALAGAAQRGGVEAALYAISAERLLRFEPEIKIVGGRPEHSEERIADLRADDLHREALRLPLPSATVQRLDPDIDIDLLASLGLPPVPRGVAYACVGTACSAPVDRAEALLHAIEETLSAPAF